MLREKAGLSQARLAQMLGVTQGAVSQWEQDIAMPGVDKLPLMAKALGCSIDELFSEARKDATGS